jgi:hypothetical protein
MTIPRSHLMASPDLPKGREFLPRPELPAGISWEGKKVPVKL